MIVKKKIAKIFLVSSLIFFVFSFCVYSYFIFQLTQIFKTPFPIERSEISASPNKMTSTSKEKNLKNLSENSQAPFPTSNGSETIKEEEFSEFFKKDLSLDLLKIKKFSKITHWSKEIIQLHSSVDPCQSICRNTLISKENHSTEEFFLKLPEFYKEHKESAFLDPEFTFAVMYLANFSAFAPLSLIEHLEDLSQSKSPIDDIYLANMIVIDFSRWVASLAIDYPDIKKLDLKIHRMKEINNRCQANILQRQEAVKQCQYLFGLI